MAPIAMKNVPADEARRYLRSITAAVQPNAAEIKRVATALATGGEVAVPTTWSSTQASAEQIQSRFASTGFDVNRVRPGAMPPPRAGLDLSAVSVYAQGGARDGTGDSTLSVRAGKERFSLSKGKTGVEIARALELRSGSGQVQGWRALTASEKSSLKRGLEASMASDYFPTTKDAYNASIKDSAEERTDRISFEDFVAKQKASTREWNLGIANIISALR